MEPLSGNKSPLDERLIGRGQLDEMLEKMNRLLVTIVNVSKTPSSSVTLVPREQFEVAVQEKIPLEFLIDRAINSLRRVPKDLGLKIDQEATLRELAELASQLRQRERSPKDVASSFIRLISSKDESLKHLFNHGLQEMFPATAAPEVVLSLKEKKGHSLRHKRGRESGEGEREDSLMLGEEEETGEPKAKRRESISAEHRESFADVQMTDNPIKIASKQVKTCVKGLKEFLSSMKRSGGARAEEKQGLALGPLTEKESTLLESFKRALLLPDYQMIYNLLESSDLSSDLSSALSLRMCKTLLESRTSPEELDLRSLIQKIPMPIEDFLGSIAQTVENDALLKQFFFYIPLKNVCSVLSNVLCILIDRGKQAEAQVLYNAVIGDVKKPTPPRPGMLSSVMETVSYLVSYSYWSLRHYRPQDRFEGLQHESIQKFMQKIMESEFVSTLALGETIEALKSIKEEAGKAIDLSPERLTREKAFIWVAEHKLPFSWAEQPEFLEMVQKTHLHSMISYYKHPFNDHPEPGILVEGKWTSCQELLTRFEVGKGAREFEIIEKGTKKRWCYLENGLTPLDPEKEIAVLRNGPSQASFSITFNFMNEGHTSSPSGIRRMSRHAWVNLLKPDGRIYSVGHLGTGIVRSPDIFEFLPGKRRSMTFNVDEVTFNRVFHEVELAQKADVHAFHYIRNNCSSFSARVASALFYPFEFHLDPRGTFERYNSFENRVKFHVISRGIAMYLVKQKEKTLEFLEDRVKTSSEKAAKLVSQAISDETIIALGLHDMHADMDFLMVSIFAMIDQEQLEVILREISLCVREEKTEILTNRFYNLLADVLDSIKDFTIDLPPVLAEKLSKMQGVVIKDH